MGSDIDAQKARADDNSSSPTAVPVIYFLKTGLLARGIAATEPQPPRSPVLPLRFDRLENKRWQAADDLRCGCWHNHAWYSYGCGCGIRNRGSVALRIGKRGEWSIRRHREGRK